MMEKSPKVQSHEIVPAKLQKGSQDATLLYMYICIYSFS